MPGVLEKDRKVRKAYNDIGQKSLSTERTSQTPFEASYSKSLMACNATIPYSDTPRE